jgi:hypothetical protein
VKPQKKMLKILRLNQHRWSRRKEAVQENIASKRLLVGRHGWRTLVV